VPFRAASGWYHPKPGNWSPIWNVSVFVKRHLWAISLLLVAGTVVAGVSEYVSAKQKFDSIENGRLRPGARVTLSYPELTAWAEKEVPRGVRNPKLQVAERDRATGTALINFAQLERSQGRQPGWLMSKLLDGERPVSVTARIRSSGGRATVAMYPDAIVGRPFELGHRIERLDIAPAAVGVVIGH
jgi:hypothetical protein